MMSSEEDPDLGGGDKKPKRVRQRVDAGEPRNSYASIPNYSPRLYPPNGYGKMLCDLGVLSNGKSSSEMVVLESNGGFGSPERCSSSGGSSDSHLLRDILQQGRHGPVGSPPDFRPPEPHSDDSNDSKASKMSVGGGGVNAAGPQEPPSAGGGAADLKRARVETIVSNMMVRTPVNGCKKRKLYQPQQHERPASEEEDEEPCSSPKRRPSSAGLFTFRQQLRHMQQQLVQMQQQYMEMVDGEDSADELDTKPFNDDDSASLYEDSGRKLVVDCDPPTDGGGERQTCIVPPAQVDIGWLAESLKAELSTSLSQVVDAVVSRCVQRKAAACKGSPPTETSTPKDPTLLSQMLDRKSPRTGGKVVDRGARVNGSSPFPADSAPPPPQPPPRPPFMFPLKPSVAATAAFLYGSPPSYAPSPPHDSSAVPEQTEAMSLVVSNKKKRHKVTDTRLNRLCPGEASPKYGGLLPHDPGMYHHHHPPPPPLVPVSLPTTVAIPNPSLNQSELFRFGGYDPHRFGPPMDDDDGGPPQVPLHALMPFHAGPHHRGSPDQMHPHHLKQDSTGDMSDTGDSPAGYDNGMAMISFLPGSMHTSTLTPMHLRKAKLMFFYARYPSSAVLKMYFPDIRFNKNNTAQLVKWFSNFREFFYIQMEKYARQAITEGVKNAEDLKVDADSELLRVLNLHYNRNNHIPAPHTFRNVVEQTLREFYKALVAGKDSEQSWKKSIYKIIARLDDSVPDYFKSPDFFDKLE